MRKHMFTLAAAGLTVSLASAVLAQSTQLGQPTKHRPGDTSLQEHSTVRSEHGTYRPGDRGYKDRGGDMSRSYYRDISVRTDDGNTMLRMDNQPDTWSTLSVSDQGVLTDVYGRHMLAAEVLGTHLDIHRERDPQTAEMFGRMMTEHLILASRARQLYRQTNTMLPDVTTNINRERLASMQWADWASGNNEQQVAYFKQTYSTVSDPRLASLISDTQTTLAGHNTMVRDQIAYNQSLTTEAVAGVRQERGDTEILMLFIGGQLMEAGRLRVEAPRLRALNNGELADHFLSMAAEHEQLAQRGGELLRSMGGEMPPAPPKHPEVNDSRDVIVRFEEHHHMSAVKKLQHFHADAQSDSVKQLMAVAIQGAQKHLDMLRMHRQQQ